MEHQQHEAAGNNGRKPIRGGLGRFSKQTSEIHSYASMMGKQNTGSRGPFMFLVIPIKEVSVEYFSGYDSSLEVPKSRILFSEMVFLFTVAWEYATLQCFNSLRRYLQTLVISLIHHKSCNGLERRISVLYGTFDEMK